MIKEHPHKNIDITLITTSQMELGVRSLSSILKQEGYNVIIGFFDSLDRKYTKKELESILNRIEEIDPKIVGISAVEYSRDKATQLILSIKRELEKPVIAGGLDVTLNPEYYLNYADYVMIGASEHSLVEFLDDFFHRKEFGKAPNLWYKEDREIVRNPIRPLIQNLDELPFEDWLDIEHHFELKDEKVKQKQEFVLDMSNHPILYRYDKSVFMFTVRGCAFHCSYCINHQLKQLNPNEKYIRKRSIESIIRRIEQLKEADPSINMVYFFDDDFFLRTKDEIKKFSKAWKEKIDLPFYVYCTPLTLSEDKLEDLVNAGLVVINMGIQTGSERVNFEIYDRKMSNKATLKSAELLHKYIGSGRFGLLPPWYDMIINNPYEKEEDLLQTIELYKKLPKPYVAFMHSLELFSGTKLYKKAVKDGLINGEDEATKYNFHDTLTHLKHLIKRGGNYYLNSLLYWMDGEHNNKRYGIVPAKVLDFLTKEKTINFFNNHQLLTSLLNYFLPTGKRLYFLKQTFKKIYQKIK